ncbi:hypothetical protein V6N12_045695 [Hibiscus sabdariffa]|uniref:DUF4283 domain-containing protein n=1 Tax=Hibiscus sabdariffa TaxID=183260 RepID=A0ABR2G3Z6_9ROSI
MSAKTLKVWVCIEGLPLVARSEFVLKSIKFNDQSVCHSDSSRSSIGRSCSRKDLSACSLDITLNNNLGDPVFPPFGPNNDPWPGKELNPPKLCDKSLEDRPAGKEDLSDVQVVEASESGTSVGHSVSIEPVFDSTTRLLSIKPKLVACLGSKSLTPNKAKSVSRKNWGSLCSQFVPKWTSSSGKNVGSAFREVGHLTGSAKDRIEADASGVNLEANLDEARASVQVCEDLALHFDGDKEVILRKFLELEKHG